MIFYYNHNLCDLSNCKDIIRNSKRLTWEFAENFKRILNSQKIRKMIPEQNHDIGMIKLKKFF